MFHYKNIVIINITIKVDDLSILSHSFPSYLNTGRYKSGNFTLVKKFIKHILFYKIINFQPL